jgi:hypothetical protein
VNTMTTQHHIATEGARLAVSVVGGGLPPQSSHIPVAVDPLMHSMPGISDTSEPIAKVHNTHRPQEVKLDPVYYQCRSARLSYLSDKLVSVTND